MRLFALSSVLLAAAGAYWQLHSPHGPAGAKSLAAAAATGAAGGAALFAILRKNALEHFPALAFALPPAALAVAAAVKLLGVSYRGGVFLGGMNPTEIFKPMAVLYTAFALSRERARLPLLCGGLAFFAAAGAILNDFGLVAVIAISALCTAFFRSAAAGAALFAGGAALAGALFAFPPAHVARRITAWLDPFADATGSGWQFLKAQETMAAGGVFGAYFGEGGAGAWLPVSESDFVFAAVCGEFGLAGCAVLLALYVLYAAGGLAVAARARASATAATAAAGFACSVAAQALVNTGGVVRAMPMTGITLPFVSHGGSSLAVTIAMTIGVFAAAGTAAEEQPKRAKRKFATIKPVTDKQRT